LKERTPDWHFEKLVEFTRFKGEIGEPSPHLAIMSHFCEGQHDLEKVWRLSCYAAVYCLPTAQVLWTKFPVDEARKLALAGNWERWLGEHWKGIVTRQERRCIRTPEKLAECLESALLWGDKEFATLQAVLPEYTQSNPKEYYDQVWDSVLGIQYFGRYIAIRFIEGLRRYCNIPARLYDMRSIGGWSPKKALVYLYPQYESILLTDTRESDQLAEKLFQELIDRFETEGGYKTDHYVLAAMLCEYRGAFENRKQYPGWTIDQEPLLYDKVAAYWGEDLATKPLWDARRAIFPPEVLGELGGWHGTRWDVAKTLRDHGYNWTDLKYRFKDTLDFATPARRTDGTLLSERDSTGSGLPEGPDLHVAKGAEEGASGTLQD
jgi:hypothetical protein